MDGPGRKSDLQLIGFLAPSLTAPESISATPALTCARPALTAACRLEAFEMHSPQGSFTTI